MGLNQHDHLIKGLRSLKLTLANVPTTNITKKKNEINFIPSPFPPITTVVQINVICIFHKKCHKTKQRFDSLILSCNYAAVKTG